MATSSCDLSSFYKLNACIRSRQLSCALYLFVVLMRDWWNVITIVIGLSVMGIWLGNYWLESAAFLLLLVSLFTQVRKLISQLWEAIGRNMGRIISPIVLTLVYFVIITPFALITRIFSRDRLVGKKPEASNWSETSKEQKDIVLENLY